MNNPIHQTQTMVTEFTCGFEEAIKNYPFGKQNCSFSLFVRGSDNQLTNLFVGNLTTNNDKEVGQYIIAGKSMKFNLGSKSVKVSFFKQIIIDWDIVQVHDGALKTITVNMRLTRKIGSIFMVIYLPLILMNILNQASFYLTTEDRYQMVINVNITCLLALASVYLGK